MNQSSQQIVTYGNTTIAYDVVFSQRKTLAIHVHPDTSVTVDAPIDTDLSEIEKRVYKRATWIIRQQRKFQQYSVDFPPRQYVSGETYRFLGQQFRLKVQQIQTGNEGVVLDREFLTVNTRRKENSHHTKELVENWYRQQGLTIFTERVDAWFPHFERLGASRPEVVARHMRTRWGSCTTSGKITLNTKLVMVNKQLIDYVVVHELCHLQEHNHGAQFQQLLSRIMPDWKERKEKLDRFDFG